MISSFNFIQVKFDLITKLVYLFKFDFFFFFLSKKLWVDVLFLRKENFMMVRLIHCP